MKHLFYIHSEITYIVSKCIINHKKIDKSDVVFLLQRHFESRDEDIQSFSNPYDYSPIRIISHLNIFKSLKKLHSFNKYIQEITENQDFQAYVPCTHTKCIQLIINHRKCERFSIFEQGTSSYINYHNIRNVYKGSKSTILDKLGYLGQIKNSKYIDERYEYIYGISEYSFPDYRRRIILDDLFEELQNDIKKKYNYLTNSAIIVLDGSSQYNDLGQGVHVLTILEILRYIRDNKIENVYYKLHPSQINTNEEKLFTLLFDEYSSGIDITRLENNISLEEVIMSEKNIKFFINVSSVGLYALMYDHKVFSALKIATKFDNEFKEYIDYYPDFFKEKLEYIK